jgi:hypothetical protein
LAALSVCAAFGPLRIGSRTLLSLRWTGRLFALSTSDRRIGRRRAATNCAMRDSRFARRRKS